MRTANDASRLPVPPPRGANDDVLARKTNPNPAPRKTETKTETESANRPSTPQNPNGDPAEAATKNANEDNAYSADYSAHSHKVTRRRRNDARISSDDSRIN